MVSEKTNSFEIVTKNKSDTVKFLCSYNGLILPRPTDGKLRYVGGFTRVLSVDRSISFAELMVKLVELCGFSVILKCELPNTDLETLITIKSDEELSLIISQYTQHSPDLKIKAVLSKPQSLKQISPPPSSASSNCSCSSCKKQHRRRYCRARFQGVDDRAKKSFENLRIYGNLGFYY